MQVLIFVLAVAIRVPWQINVLIYVGFAIAIGWPILSRISRSNPRRFQMTSLVTSGAEFELYPYLLSKGEDAFLYALEQAIGNRYRIAIKVRLGDLVKVRGNGSGPTTARNKTQQKHVDFVLCTHHPVKLVMAIELDDKTHADRQERDQYVNQCLACAGLPILHVSCQRTYDVAQLLADINATIAVAGSR
jgi:hypothetical protein